MKLGITTTLQTTFDDAVARTRVALAEQGFGVLTEIDVTATLKTKIGAEMENYLILGACNPPLAHSALSATRQIGLLLPCNVVVREDSDNPGSIIVDAMNPGLMVGVTGDDTPTEVAASATQKLTAAIDSLSGTRDGA